MQDTGAVEPGKSDWYSPTVLVPKPDQIRQLCIDYRKVNHVTRTDAFPIPQLEGCMGKLNLCPNLIF